WGGGIAISQTIVPSNYRCFVTPPKFPGEIPLLFDCFRPPIVAKCDQKRVLSSWVSYCCNMVPEEFQVEFSSVRHLNPLQFLHIEFGDSCT
ncbi:hypothetical protein glysoja_030168, partial [Glycine soja]